MDIIGLKGKVDFAIITIRDDEHQAVIDRLPKSQIVKGKRHYSIHVVKNKNKQTCLVAVAAAIEQGTGEAQNLTHDLIDDLDPQCILVVGIAGGVPDSDFTLGDVVLSLKILDYTVSAAKEEKPREYEVSGGKIDKKTASLVKLLPNVGDKLKGWNSKSSIKMSKPTIDLEDAKSKLYGSKEWREKVYKSLEHHFRSNNCRENPTVTSGTIISSDILIKDTLVLIGMLQNSKSAKCVEMESAGVYRAVMGGEKQYLFIAIRGISDIVGYERDPTWTAYACNTAAAFAINFIKSGYIEARSISKKNEVSQIFNGSSSNNLECNAEQKNIKFECVPYFHIPISSKKLYLVSSSISIISFLFLLFLYWYYWFFIKKFFSINVNILFLLWVIFLVALAISHFGSKITKEGFFRVGYLNFVSKTDSIFLAKISGICSICNSKVSLENKGKNEDKDKIIMGICSKNPALHKFLFSHDDFTGIFLEQFFII